jgi:DNA topoisomerase-6 subunit B
MKPKEVSHANADAIFKTIQETKLMAPPTDCLSPIGEEILVKSLKKEVDAEFFTSITRPTAVYRGVPFQIEAAIAYGGSLQADNLVRLLRFANKVPLQYQQSACAVTSATVNTLWTNYGMQQSRGALPSGAAMLVVHIASVWVPFTSESKESIAHYPEIIKEIKLALQGCGRLLGRYLSKKRKVADAEKKKSYITKYIPHIGEALKDLLSLKETDEKKVIILLTEELEKSRKM